MFNNISFQNEIIDNPNFINSLSDSLDNGLSDPLDNSFDYLGYVYIPRFNVKRLIKYGTSSDVLDDGFVGMHFISSDICGDGLIILAGHNTSNVFSSLHSISIGDEVFIFSRCYKKFIVYDVKVVSSDDTYYMTSNRSNELLLITCMRKEGYRLFVFLREEL
jgi:LPXTG-site transpeptidase (sortase) family protein